MERYALALIYLFLASLLGSAAVWCLDRARREVPSLFEELTDADRSTADTVHQR